MKLIAILFLGVLSLPGCVSAALPEEKNMSSNLSDPIHPTVVKTADERALQLGYDPKEFDKQITRDKKIYKIEYTPKDKFQLGGGVSIWVDEDKMAVVREVRMQ